MKLYKHTNVHVNEGYDRRIYIPSIARSNIDEVLAEGFVPCDPVSGEEIRNLNRSAIYDMWSNGDIDLCKIS